MNEEKIEPKKADEAKRKRDKAGKGALLIPAGENWGQLCLWSSTQLGHFLFLSFPKQVLT